MPECLLSENGFWNDLSIQPLFESINCFLSLFNSWLFHCVSNLLSLNIHHWLQALEEHISRTWIFREEGEGWRRGQESFYLPLGKNRITKNKFRCHLDRSFFPIPKPWSRIMSAKLFWIDEKSPIPLPLSLTVYFNLSLSSIRERFFFYFYLECCHNFLLWLSQ